MIENFESWLKENRRLNPASRRQYVLQAKKFLDDCEEPSLENIIKFIVAGNRNYARLFAVKTFCYFLDKKDWIAELDKMKTKPKLKERRYPRYIEFETFKKMLDGLDSELRCALMILYDTGMRISPLINMKAKQIKRDKDGYYITATEKGGKLAKRYLDPHTFEILKGFIDNAEADEYIFRRKVQAQNGKMRWETFWECYYRHWKSLKIQSRKFLDVGYGISFHWVRTSRAKELYQKYKDILKVKSFLNHSAIATTMRYIDESAIKSAEIIADEKGKWD